MNGVNQRAREPPRGRPPMPAGGRRRRAVVPVVAVPVVAVRVAVRVRVGCLVLCVHVPVHSSPCSVRVLGQILHERVEVGLGDRRLERRHRPGLLVRAARRPSGSTSAWRMKSSSDNPCGLRPLAQIVERRADPRPAPTGIALNLWQAMQPLSRNDLLSCRTAVTAPVSGVRRLLAPGLELRLRHHDRLTAHQRVAEAAQLGADHREGAEPVRRDHDLLGIARNGVLLLRELRHPERVDDVPGDQRQLELPVDRHAQHRVVGLALVVGELPCELLCDRLDLQRVVAGIAVLREDDRARRCRSP